MYLCFNMHVPAPLLPVRAGGSTVQVFCDFEEQQEQQEGGMAAAPVAPVPLVFPAADAVPSPRGLPSWAPSQAPASGSTASTPAAAMAHPGVVVRIHGAPASAGGGDADAGAAAGSSVGGGAGLTVLLYP